MFGSGHRDFECPVLHLPNCAANPADRIPLSLIRAVKKHLVHHGLYNEQNHQASKLKSIFHQMYLYARWIYIYISPRWTSSQDLSQDLIFISICIQIPIRIPTSISGSHHYLDLSIDLSRDLFNDSQVPLYHQLYYRQHYSSELFSLLQPAE